VYREVYKIKDLQRGLTMSKNNDIKRELFAYSTGDYFSLKEYFEEKARDGWLIQKVKFSTAIYKRIEPTDLIFAIGIYPNLHEIIDKDDVKLYKSKYEDVGWSHAISFGNLHIFYSKKEDNLMPVQTEEEIRKIIAEKPLRSELFIIIMHTLLSVFYLSINLPYEYDNLFSNLSMIMPFILPLIFLTGVALNVREYSYFRRAKKSVKTNKPLPNTNLKRSNIIGTTSLLILRIVSITAIIALILDSTINFGMMVSILVILILTIIIGITYTKEIKVLKISKISKVILLIFIIVPLTIFTLLSTSRMTSSNSDDLRPGYIGLTHEDFGSEIIPEHKSFRREGSILVPKYSSYRESSSLMGFETVSIETRGSKIAKYIFDEMVNEELNHRVYRNRVLKDSSNEYSGYDEAYYIENPNADIKNSSLFLLKDNKIIFLDTDIDLSESKYVKIISDKIKE
jgi:hypothetical protein